jgi:hypothetical protein
MKELRFLFLLVFTTLLGFSQDSKTVSIGILSDTSTKETESLLHRLQNEIVSVVGEDATIQFRKILVNDYNLESAKEYYHTLLNDETDIILGFGTINSLVITAVKEHKKPTILFGDINVDFIDLNEDNPSSGIDNFNYLITSRSYKNDLQTFKKIVGFQNVGILVEDYLLGILPLKETLDSEMAKLGASYKLIPFKDVSDIKNGLVDVDAVYLAGGFLLSDSEIKDLARFFISRQLPSFTSTNLDDVVNGLLATNQAEENIAQFFRRIALNIEDIVNGVNASELSIYLDFSPNLTVNFNTAQQIGVPTKYSLIAITNFVGDFDNVTSEKKYTLLDVMRETIDNNLTLQSRRKDIELEQQDLKLAKSNYLPDVSASASGIYIDPDLAEISGGQMPMSVFRKIFKRPNRNPTMP